MVSSAWHGLGFPYFHKRRKQIAMSEVGKKARLVCAGYDRQCNLDGFLADVHYEY